MSDEFDCGVVFEEVREDDAILPIFEEKIIGKVEKIDWGARWKGGGGGGEVEKGSVWWTEERPDGEEEVLWDEERWSREETDSVEEMKSEAVASAGVAPLQWLEKDLIHFSVSVM